MPETRTNPLGPTSGDAGPEAPPGAALAQLEANGWLAGHGSSQQLDSFLAAMRDRAVQDRGSADGSDLPAPAASGGAWDAGSPGRGGADPLPERDRPEPPGR
jgi:hypothetical protein